MARQVVLLLILLGGPGAPTADVEHATPESIDSSSLEGEVVALLAARARPQTGLINDSLHPWPPNEFVAAVAGVTRTSRNGGGAVATLIEAGRRAGADRSTTLDVVAALLVQVPYRDGKAAEAHRLAHLRHAMAHAPGSLLVADIAGGLLRNGSLGLDAAGRAAFFSSIEPKHARDYWRGVADLLAGKLSETRSKDAAHAWREPVLATFRSALDGNPAPARVHFAIGQALFDFRRYEEARVELEKVGDWQPFGIEGEMGPKYYLGRTLLELGRPKEAREALKRAAGERGTEILDPLAPWQPIDLGPQYLRHLVEVVCLVGRSYAEERAFDDAQRIFARANGACRGASAKAFYDAGDYFHALVEWRCSAPFPYDDEDGPGPSAVRVSDAWEHLGRPDLAESALGMFSRDCSKTADGPECERLRRVHDAVSKTTPPVVAWPGLEPARKRLRAKWVPSFTEHPLPPGAPLLKPPAFDRSRAEFRDVSIQQSGQVGDRVLVVSLVPGDSSYWIHISFDGGVHFEGPYFVGLAASSRVVSSTSHVAAFVGETLQIEMSTKQGMFRAAPAGSSTFLALPIEVVRRDTDGDGLTDVHEAWLSTEPGSRDTDRDAIPDAVDPEPINPVGRATELDEIVAATLGRSLFGQRPSPRVAGRPMAALGRALVVLQSPSPLFAGYDLPFRVLSLPPEAGKEYLGRFAEPPRVGSIGRPTFNAERSEVLFDYSIPESSGCAHATRGSDGKWTGELLEHPRVVE